MLSVERDRHRVVHVPVLLSNGQMPKVSLSTRDFSTCGLPIDDSGLPFRMGKNHVGGAQVYLPSYLAADPLYAVAAGQVGFMPFIDVRAFERERHHSLVCRWVDYLVLLRGTLDLINECKAGRMPADCYTDDRVRHAWAWAQVHGTIELQAGLRADPWAALELFFYEWANHLWPGFTVLADSELAGGLAADAPQMTARIVAHDERAEPSALLVDRLPAPLRGAVEQLPDPPSSFTLIVIPSAIPDHSFCAVEADPDNGLSVERRNVIDERWPWTVGGSAAYGSAYGFSTVAYGRALAEAVRLSFEELLAAIRKPREWAQYMEQKLLLPAEPYPGAYDSNFFCKMMIAHSLLAQKLAEPVPSPVHSVAEALCLNMITVHASDVFQARHSDREFNWDRLNDFVGALAILHALPAPDLDADPNLGFENWFVPYRPDRRNHPMLGQQAANGSALLSLARARYDDLIPDGEFHPIDTNGVGPERLGLALSRVATERGDVLTFSVEPDDTGNDNVLFIQRIQVAW